jgi:hypothetical protein
MVWAIALQQQPMSRFLTWRWWKAWLTQLSRRHIGVVGEEYAVSKDVMELFGVIDLETSFDGCRFAI